MDDTQTARSNSESIKAIAESTVVLAIVRVFQLIGIPVILTFLYWISSQVYQNTIQVAVLNSQVQANRAAAEARAIWAEKELDSIDRRLEAMSRNSTRGSGASDPSPGRE